MLSGKIPKIYTDISWKHGNVTVKDFQKYEKLKHEQSRLKLDIDFLNNCQQLRVYPKFLIFKLLNISNKYALSVHKRLFCSVINKRNKQLWHVSKELSQSETFVPKQLSTIDFYFLDKFITFHNKKSLQKLISTQHKKLCSLTTNCSIPTLTSNETVTKLTQYKLSQKESDLLKAGLYFSIQRDKIRKSEIFTSVEKIHGSLSTTLNPKKLKIR